MVLAPCDLCLPSVCEKSLASAVLQSSSQLQVSIYLLGSLLHVVVDLNFFVSISSLMLSKRFKKDFIQSF